MISLAIPYHNTENTAFYISRLLKSINEQSYKDVEVILTNEGPFARNHNAAIQKAKGDYVQMLQMDDYFAHHKALEKIVQTLEKSETGWMITACRHDTGGTLHSPHIPQWTDDIYTGNNRLGSVSTLSFRRDHTLLFEEPLTWVVDCDLYYRLFIKYGLPTINPDYGLVITERPDRLSNTISSLDKQKEVEYLISKYHHAK